MRASEAGVGQSEGLESGPVETGRRGPAPGRPSGGAEEGTGRAWEPQVREAAVEPGAREPVGPEPG